MNTHSTTIVRTDEDQLEALIQRRLQGRVWVRGFRVLIQEQGLVLQGRVSTFYAKQLVQHAAMEVGGHSVLANDIEVQ